MNTTPDIKSRIFYMHEDNRNHHDNLSWNRRTSRIFYIANHAQYMCLLLRDICTRT